MQSRQRTWTNTKIQNSLANRQEACCRRLAANHSSCLCPEWGYRLATFSLEELVIEQYLYKAVSYTEKLSKLRHTILPTDMWCYSTIPFVSSAACKKWIKGKVSGANFSRNEPSLADLRWGSMTPGLQKMQESSYYLICHFAAISVSFKSTRSSLAAGLKLKQMFFLKQVSDTSSKGFFDTIWHSMKFYTSLMEPCLKRLSNPKANWKGSLQILPIGPWVTHIPRLSCQSPISSSWAHAND